MVVYGAQPGLSARRLRRRRRRQDIKEEDSLKRRILQSRLRLKVAAWFAAIRRKRIVWTHPSFRTAAMEIVAAAAAAAASTRGVDAGCGPGVVMGAAAIWPSDAATCCEQYDVREERAHGAYGCYECV